MAISYQSLSPQEVVAYSCDLVWKRFTHVQRRNWSGKLVPNLRRCISVTDDIKINEQNKSIGIGPLYLQTEFEANCLLLPKVMVGLNPVGYRTLQYWHGASARLQNVFYHSEMV